MTIEEGIGIDQDHQLQNVEYYNLRLRESHDMLWHVMYFMSMCILKATIIGLSNGTMRNKNTGNLTCLLLLIHIDVFLGVLLQTNL